MEELQRLITQAQAGNLDAFTAIVQRTQDMAVGYAYSILGDFHLAEDAAQEAFIGAWRDLNQLREPSAFRGWFRRVIFKQCNRITRREHFETVPLEAAINQPIDGNDPAEALEAQETKSIVLRAIDALSEKQRQVITLFYISGYSQKEIADFVGVGVTIINSRLQSARNRLKSILSSEERIMTMVKETLSKQAPSQDTRFTDKVLRMIQPESMKTDRYQYGVETVDGNEAWQMFQACVAGDLDGVNRLLEKDTNLVNTQYWYQLPIHLAVRGGHAGIVKLLLESGTDPGQSRYTYNSWDKLLHIAQERGHSEIYGLLEVAMKKRFK